MILTTLTKLFTSRKSWLMAGGVFVVGLLGGLDMAWAVSTQPSDALEGFATLASMLIKVLTFLAFLLMSFGGKLMSSELLLDGVSVEAIRSMWVVVRNVTNIGFVLVLLFLAFSNLFSGLAGGGNWTIKEKLPKVILALIAVNFSLLGFRVLIDATQVGTEAVLSIARSTMQAKGIENLGDVMNNTFDEKGGKCTLEDVEKPRDDCKSFAQWVNHTMCKNGKPGQDVSELDECYFYLNSDFWEKKLTDVESDDHTVINLFMTFGSFFQHFERLPALAADTDSWTEVIDNVLFSLIMGLAFVIAMVALFVVLILRVVVLWILMVFSPLLVAGMIMGVGEADGFSKKVVTYLLIPLKFAAVLAVTMVMLMVQIDLAPLNDGLELLKLGPALNQFGSGPWSILWQIATVVIFWKAAFWAVDGTEADFIVNGVKNAAQKMGSYTAKSLTVDRALPASFGLEGVSLTSLSKLPDILNQARLSKIGKQRNSLEGGVNSILGVEDPETTKAKQDFRERVTKFDRNEALSRGGLQTFLSETKALPTALQDNREEASKILNRIEKNGDNSLSGAQTKLKDKDKKEAILKLITSRSIEEQKTGWRELQLPEEQIKKIYDKNVSASKKADESNQKMTLSVNKKDISLDHTIFSANQARVNSEDKGEVLKLLKDAGLTSAELSGFEEKALADLANQLKENKQINLAATPDTILAALKEIKGKSST